ncbi:toprim domain-containing protein [Sunxiuqinia elliptica]
MLAFQNNSNGYELRNQYFKGCTSKAITSYVKNTRNPVFVFEGCFDLVSLFELAKREGNLSIQTLKQCNFIVLNSTGLIGQAIEALKPFQDIRLFLDNDTAGRQCAETIIKMFPHAKNRSKLYEGYKDLNEFLMSADKPSVVSFLSRCAIVRTKLVVSPDNGNLAFSPDGRKRSSILDRIDVEHTAQQMKIRKGRRL